MRNLLMVFMALAAGLWHADGAAQDRGPVRDGDVGYTLPPAQRYERGIEPRRADGPAGAEVAQERLHTVREVAMSSLEECYDRLKEDRDRLVNENRRRAAKALDRSMRAIRRAIEKVTRQLDRAEGYLKQSE